MTSQRQNILTTLTSLMESITTDNGYDHNVTVYRGKARLDDNELKQVPVVTILQAPKTDGLESPQHGPDRRCNWELYLTGFVKNQGPHPTDAAEALLWDVKRALIQVRDPRSTWSAQFKPYHVNNILVGEGICRPPEEQHDAAIFLLPLTVTFIESWG